MGPTTQPAEGEPDDSVGRFVFEQTQRALDRQAVVLAEFRQRTSMILSATGIVASLLGATALKDGHPRELVYGALAATAIGIGLCLAGLRSVNDTKDDAGREWKVTLSAEELNSHLDGKCDVRDLVRILEPWRKKNYATIKDRSRLFWWASAALPVQLGLWASVVLL
jgi:hypothetical protein